MLESNKLKTIARNDPIFIDPELQSAVPVTFVEPLSIILRAPI